MKFSMKFAFYPSVIAAFIASVVSWPVKRQDSADLSKIFPVDGEWAATYAPNLGFINLRVNPGADGKCDGAVDNPDGTPVRIPCECPPTQEEFQKALAKNIEANQIIGNPNLPIFFPITDEYGPASARIQASIDTIQTSMGCPIESTTLAEQLRDAQPPPGTTTAPPLPNPTD